MSQTGPRISGVLLTFNSERYVASALQSVLAQDCEPMDLLVSDDCSTDRTYEILQRLLAGYAGPHQVRLRRRDSNAGSKSAHLNDALPRTSGELIVSFDDDDVSLPQRVRSIVEAFDADAAVQAVFSRYHMIDADGRRIGPGNVPHPPDGVSSSDWFARVDAYASGTTLAVRRNVVDRFGPLDPRINEDVVLPFRASLLGRVHFIDAELVGVRKRDDSLTAHPERFDSIESYRERMLRGIEQARRQLDSRLSDLARARTLQPGRMEEFDSIELRARRSLEHAQMTAELVSPSGGRRLRALWRVLRAGIYRDELLQNLALALLPGPYLRYKRRSTASTGNEDR